MSTEKEVIPALSLIDGGDYPIRSGYYKQLDKMSKSIVRQLNRTNLPIEVEYQLRAALFKNLQDMAYYRSKFYVVVEPQHCDSQKQSF